MTTHLSRIALMFIFTTTSVACSLFTSTPAPSLADIDKEEQAVYAVFVGESKGPVLILQNTSMGTLEEDPQQMIANIKGGLPGISKATIDSYIERNAQPDPLSLDMQFGVEYALLSQEELAEISSQPNWHEILQERYPGSQGYFIFSHVGFNRSLDQAVIYVGNVAGPLMGQVIIICSKNRQVCGR